MAGSSRFKLIPLVLFLSACFAIVNSQRSRKNNRAEYKKSPHLVTVRRSRGSPSEYGGVLVSVDDTIVVLTAASAVVVEPKVKITSKNYEDPLDLTPLPPYELSVIPWATREGGYGENVVSVRKVVVHDQFTYGTTQLFNIAILFLDGDVDIRVDPLKLPRGNRNMGNKDVFVFQEKGKEGFKVHKVTVMPSRECADRMDNGFQPEEIFEYQFCIQRNRKWGKGPHKIGIGLPALMKTRQGMVVQGIQFDSGWADRIVLFTRVGIHIDWIKDAVEFDDGQ